ncbi:MAG: hypothetical protein ACKO2Y_00930 [Actinomycetota bacterium]
MATEGITRLSVDEFLRAADGIAARVAAGERIEVVDRTGAVHDLGPICAEIERGPVGPMTVAEFVRRFRVVDPAFERDVAHAGDESDAGDR